MPAPAPLLPTVPFLSQSAQVRATRLSGGFGVGDRKTPESFS